MLMLTRRPGESIIIGKQGEIKITVNREEIHKRLLAKGEAL